MTDIRSTITALGRAALSEALDCSASAINMALKRGSFPASWFVIVERMCVEKGLECPRHMFSFIDDPLPDTASDLAAASKGVSRAATDPQGNKVSEGAS